MADTKLSELRSLYCISVALVSCPLILLACAPITLRRRGITPPRAGYLGLVGLGLGALFSYVAASVVPYRGASYYEGASLTEAEVAEIISAQNQAEVLGLAALVGLLGCVALGWVA